MKEQQNGSALRRAAFVLLAAAVLSAGVLSVPVLTARAGDEIMRYPAGDVDLSGETDASDLTAMARYVGKIADLPADGYTLSIADLTAFAQSCERREIVSTEVRDGRLYVTYADGTVVIAGDIDE